MLRLLFPEPLRLLRLRSGFLLSAVTAGTLLGFGLPLAAAGVGIGFGLYLLNIFFLYEAARCLLYTSPSPRDS